MRPSIPRQARLCVNARAPRSPKCRRLLPGPTQRSPRGTRSGARRRTAILREFQRHLHEKKSDIARLITREAGKPYVEALLTEVQVVLDAARFCIENAYGFLREERIPHGNLAMKTKRGSIVREPYGVIGIISPWNYPFSIPATESMAALVTGNAVVLKPSELTSLVRAGTRVVTAQGRCAARMCFKSWSAMGRPARLWSTLAIDKLVFTGSVPTGRSIAQAAAARLLPVTLELGGKDPMLVLTTRTSKSRRVAQCGVRSSMPDRRVCRSSAVTCIAVYVRAVPASLRAQSRSNFASAMAWIRKPNGAVDPRDVNSATWNCKWRTPGPWRASSDWWCSTFSNWARIFMRPRCWLTSPMKCASCARKRLGLFSRSCRLIVTTRPSGWPMTPNMVWRPACGLGIAPEEKRLPAVSRRGP